MPASTRARICASLDTAGPRVQTILARRTPRAYGCGGCATDGSANWTRLRRFSLSGASPRRHGGVGVDDAVAVEAVERGRADAGGVELGTAALTGVGLQRRVRA